MRHTEYGVLTTEELLLFVITKPSLTPLEAELAQRLTLAMDMLGEQASDAGSEGKASH